MCTWYEKHINYEAFNLNNFQIFKVYVNAARQTHKAVKLCFVHTNRLWQTKTNVCMYRTITYIYLCIYTISESQGETNIDRFN